MAEDLVSEVAVCLPKPEGFLSNDALNQMQNYIYIF